MSGPPAGPGASGVPVCVGIDLGTSSIKAVALGPDGRVVASARRGYPTSRPAPGVAEQDPRSWWRGLEGVLGEIRGAVPVARWRALGLTAMLPTLLVLDRRYRPLGPAITWQDGRAEPHGARLREKAGADALYRRTGQWLDGRYLLPMAEALLEREPDLAPQARFVVGAKDYLFHRLTGELRTDPSTAAGYGSYDLGTGRWAPDLPGDLHLPEVAGAHSVAPLRAGAADDLGLPAALPVALGAADSVLGALALGALAPGGVGYLAGSSTVILAPLPRPSFDAAHRFLVTPTVGGGIAAEMDLLATGSAQGWLAGMLGSTADAGPEASAAAAGERQPAARAPIFLPYLAPGEQGALWDPDLSGALLGLTLAHRPEDLTRALRTGIVVESARCIGVLGESIGTGGDVHAGGSAVSPASAQDLADATGRRVLLDEREGSQSARGAAILAAEAVGAVADRDRGPDPDSGPDPDRGPDPATRGAAATIAYPAGRPRRRALVPDPDRRDWWASTIERHDAARRAIAGLGVGGDQAAHHGS